jgi:ribosomal protein S14
MPSKAQIERWKKEPKFKTRKRNFCFRCGRQEVILEILICVEFV